MSKPKKNKTNAVLYKEMTIDMKRPKIMIIMLLINMFLAPISLCFFLGIMISSVTKIVNIISYVLIAFVSISLIVSSIMIAIITYISVLERTKEIGILRSIGASKKDVGRVFNAETIIEGLFAGVMGIIITLIISIPVNIMHL